METSEQVGRGHPDKVADAVSDAILCELRKIDKNCHAGIETLVCGDCCHTAGEISYAADLPLGLGSQFFNNIAKDIIEKIGYSTKAMKMLCNVVAQSEDIKQGVDNKGAGDQGIITGYAAGYEYTHYLGLAHFMTTRLQELLDTECPKLLGKNYQPDSKCQVTIDESDSAVCCTIKQVVIAQSHKADISEEEVKKLILDNVIGKWLKELADKQIIDKKFRLEIIINGTGAFVECGPAADCGLTGRKLVCDSYGGYAPIGGGNTWGKDLTKVDRSAAYFCRNIAVNILKYAQDKNEPVRSVLINASFCIGQPHMMSFSVNLERDTYTPFTDTYAKKVSDAVKNITVSDFEGFYSDSDISDMHYGYTYDLNRDWNKPEFLNEKIKGLED